MSQELEVRVMRAGEEGDMPLMLAEDVADEIRRLRSVAQAETEMRVGTFDTITKLQARVERLKGALRRIADKSAWDGVMELKSLARAALEAKS